MNRACFSCDGDVEVLHRACWDLPGLPSTEIGFGTCTGCGLVLQSPCVAPDEVARWYAESAVYTNPGRAGRPHPRKVRGTTRLIHAVEHALGRVPETVVQIGCSDGYALSRFRAAGAQRVLGLDPSAASCALARERYGVEAVVGTIEDPPELPQAELWVVTHVLEHLHDPLACLRRARAAATPPWLAVEVPLFERPDRLPPGYLSFEHLQYFTEESLVRALATCGFEVVGLDKEYADDQYPVVAAMARPAEPRSVPPDESERRRDRARLERCLARERDLWQGTSEQLATELEKGDAERPLWLFGAGVFASQVLANTGLAEQHEIAGILDSSASKRGTALGRHRVSTPEDVELRAGDRVVITSFASEAEIWQALAPERERGVHVIRLFPS